MKKKQQQQLLATATAQWTTALHRQDKHTHVLTQSHELRIID